LTNQEFLGKVKELVSNYTNLYSEKEILPEEVWIVWYCKTLQNHKALSATPLLDGRFYEVTYNGDKNEIYFDTYKKFENRRIEL
jgi:hypothetical protein